MPGNTEPYLWMSLGEHDIEAIGSLGNLTSLLSVVDTPNRGGSPVIANSAFAAVQKFIPKAYVSVHLNSLANTSSLLNPNPPALDSSITRLLLDFEPDYPDWTDGSQASAVAEFEAFGKEVHSHGSELMAVGYPSAHGFRKDASWNFAEFAKYLNIVQVQTQSGLFTDGLPTFQEQINLLVSQFKALNIPLDVLGVGAAIGDEKHAVPIDLAIQAYQYAVSQGIERFYIGAAGDTISMTAFLQALQAL